MGSGSKCSRLSSTLYNLGREGPGRVQVAQQQSRQPPTFRQGGPVCTVEHLVAGTKSDLACRPISSSCVLRQVRVSNSDAKGDSNGAMASGRLGMMSLW